MAEGRTLTPGEISAAREVFGDALRYQEVRVISGKYVFFQPSNTAMTPNGNIYFPAPVYKADFSTDISDSAWIIHELTHAWQYQTGVNVRLLAPFSRNYDYGRLNAQMNFSGLNIEQQAAVVADYYLQKHGYAPQHGAGTLRDYEAVLPFAPMRVGR